MMQGWSGPPKEVFSAWLSDKMSAFGFRGGAGGATIKWGDPRISSLSSNEGQPKVWSEVYLFIKTILRFFVLFFPLLIFILLARVVSRCFCFMHERCVVTQTRSEGKLGLALNHGGFIDRWVFVAAGVRAGGGVICTYSTVSGCAPAALNKANSLQLWTVNRAEHSL